MEDDTSKMETETPENETEKSEEGKSKDLQSALAQKEHFRGKFQTSQEELKRLQEKISAFTEKQQSEGKAELPKGANILGSTNPLELVRLNKALEGYSEEEVEFIIRNAPEKTIDGVINATKDEWVRTAVGAKREKAEKDKKVPSPTDRSPVVGGKRVTEMSDKEKRSNFAEIVRQAVAKGKGKTSRNI